MAITFIERAVTFIEGAVMFIKGAITFIKGAVTFIKGAITFIGEESLAIGGGLFKTARISTGVVDAVKGVNKRNLRQWLIIYKLKGPSLLINSLISASNHSIGLSSWATLYSACGTNLLFLLKTHTPLY